MSFSCFVGIDVSKKTIAAALYVSASTPFIHQQFENRPSGFRALLTWANKQTSDDNMLFCLEHSGIYALPLCCFFTQQKLQYSLQSPLQVKKSMGIQRGKSDKADAQMLARYAYLYREEIKLSQLPSPCLLKSKVALEVSAKELATFTDKAFSSHIAKDSQRHVKQLERSLLSIDKQLAQIVKEDKEVNRVYELATSVSGVGLQTAALMIVHTQCFTSFDDWRQFACYAGTAPFEHTSGTSVRGKTRLSKVSNMKMKALISNGACSVIQSENEFSAYYNRKLAAGKPKLVALNGVKNKLISRVFAVVQRGKPYVKDHQKYLQLAG
jgi:transposase